MDTHNCLYSISRMNIDSVASFLEDQSKLNQSHCSKKERIQTVLNFQHNIRNYKTIPKQYMPSNFPEIPTGNQSLSTDFHQEYSTLFFKYLDKVITHNVISQELEDPNYETFPTLIKFLPLRKFLQNHLPKIRLRK